MSLKKYRQPSFHKKIHTNEIIAFTVNTIFFNLKKLDFFSYKFSSFLFPKHKKIKIIIMLSKKIKFENQ